MKDLDFNRNDLDSQSDLAAKVYRAIQRVENNSLFNLRSVRMYGDEGPQLGKQDFRVFLFIQDLVHFCTHYMWQVLSHNPGALERKIPPYDLSLMLRVSFSRRLFECTFYLDDNMYGLFVGKEHSNVNNFIRSLFPIFSKVNLEINVRFLPASRV
jgi:hypothetical protein